MSVTSPRDRYVTFDGLDCDTNARKVVDYIRRYIDEFSGKSPWADYFQSKLQENQRLGLDELFFVGSQMNNIYSFFADVGNEEINALLYQVEQECC